MARLLVIDDDRTVLRMVERAFDRGDVDVVTAKTADDGLAAIREQSPDVALLDVFLAETNGLDLYRQIQAIDGRLPVVFITASGASDTAIEAMSLGAYDYLLKPLDLAKVREVVERALEIRRLMQVPVSVAAAESAPSNGDLLIGRSPKMQEVYKAIGRVAPQDVIVLVRGESGTGKELVARAIYQHSARSDGPFLAVNCAAIPEALLESELFGHEKGAFTGAESRRIGKFEQCSGGTIFLDEFGDMSPLIQSKVLRVLQEQRFERVGGNTTLQTDVRLIAATNRDLEKMVAAGEFREDLFYRLNGFAIRLPPLRERGDDLLLLLEHFLHRYRLEFGRDAHGVAPDALELLRQYTWPGNVRELQSVLKQALLQGAGPWIIEAFLPETVRRGDVAAAASDLNGGDRCDLPALIDERLKNGAGHLYAEAQAAMDRYLLMRVLRETKGNQSQAAAILGITRGCLRGKLRDLNLSISTTVTVREPS